MFNRHWFNQYNGKVKNESACAQQKCWFAEKNQCNGNRANYDLIFLVIQLVNFDF